MNIIALISALTGVTLIHFSCYFGNKVNRLWLRYPLMVVGILASLLIMVNVASIGERYPMEHSRAAGIYFVFSFVAYLVGQFVWSMVKKSKKSKKAKPLVD